MHEQVKALMDKLDGRTTVLAVALEQWSQRDDSAAQPEVREAANTAMDAINAMLSDLHAARAMLAAEMRVSDDAAGARVDAMLSVPLEERLAAREARIRGELGK